MRLPKLSQAGLVVGITLGLLALWASAGPVIGPGHSAVGGDPWWYPVWALNPSPGHYVGLTWYEGGWATQYNGWTIVLACTNGHLGDGTSMHCIGGNITAASGKGSVPLYWGGLAGCSRGVDSDERCDRLYNVNNS